jgi:adenylate kinase
MKRVVLFGPPGAGKGTQGVRLAKAWNVPHIASGDLLRRLIEAGGDTPDTREARTIAEGKYVSDEFATRLVFEQIDTHGANGFVLDGYPRNLAQAQTLGDHLTKRRQALDAVIALEVSEAELLVRLGGRLTCTSCGATYHARYEPPKAEGICDRCNNALTVRPDDAPDAIRTRLAIYEERTRPIAEYYERAGILRRVKAEGTEDEVFARCLEAGDGR